MAEKTEKKIEKLEREYTIPLRRQVSKVPRYKKANKAIRTIKEFLVRHMNIRDGDLNKVKIDKYLNEEIWFRGIRKPPQKIKVKVVKEGDIVRVELFEYKDKLKFKKAREDKKNAQAEEVVKTKKATAKPEEPAHDHVHDHAHPTPEGVPSERGKERTEEEKKDEKEKQAAVVEAGQKLGKEMAKNVKHQTPSREKGPKRPQRKSLEK